LAYRTAVATPKYVPARTLALPTPDAIRDAQHATGQYPGPVWAVKSWSLAEADHAVPIPPSATGKYPSPVWSGAPMLPGDRLLTDPALRRKDPGYSDETGSDADEAHDSAEPEGSTALDNREIYRIVREVAVVDSGDDLYSAVMAQDPFGLCFGLTLFTQASGHLGAVLSLMLARDPEQFRALFGPNATALLAVTNASAGSRLEPVGGENLSAASWMDRFRQAGAYTPFQAAQNEQAIEGQFRPMLHLAAELGLTSDRGLAMAFDRVVTCGLGAGMRWVIAAAGPLRTEQQRQGALEDLGYASLPEFQADTPWLPQNGVFGPETHAAMAGALRRLGDRCMPSCEDLMGRLVSAAAGPAKTRLMRLRHSAKLQDVYYRF
jgi:hypothetical protein